MEARIAPPRRLTVAQALGVSLVVLAAAAACSLLVGAGSVGPGQAIDALRGGGTDEARFVVFDLRLPRTVVGVTVGLALGVAGAVLQSAARNPLAEPGLLGVSAGASFAVVLAIWFGASAMTVYTQVAILGAMIGCLLALGAARLTGIGDDPVRLVLAGVALSSMLGAASSMLLLIDQRTRDEIRFWTVGAIAGRDYGVVIGILPTIVIGVAVAATIARPLSAMALGERVALGLGHRPRLTRVLAMVGVALLVGSATAAAGPIAFVGLAVPFAARALVGPDIRPVLLVCAVLGPVMVLFADISSRLLVRPSEMPIGVVTAFIGAPVLVGVVRSHRLPTL